MLNHAHSILIVDDYKLFADSLVAWFGCEFPGTNCIIAGTLAEAMKILYTNSIDLLITDIKIPGVKVFSDLKPMFIAAEHIPTIIVSGEYEIEDTTPKELFPSVFLTKKDINSYSLKQALGEVLGKDG